MGVPPNHPFCIIGFSLKPSPKVPPWPWTPPHFLYQSIPFIHWAWAGHLSVFRPLAGGFGTFNPQASCEIHERSIIAQCSPVVSFFLLGSAREWTWRLAANPRVLGVLSRLMATTVLGQSIIFHKSEISNPAVRLFDVCFLFRKRLHGCPKDAENHFKTQDMHRSGSPGNYSEYF